MLAQRREVGVADEMRFARHLHREVEHRALARRDVGLAMVDRDLVGDERVLLVDAQQRAVGDDAVEAAVDAAGGDDDHLLVALAEARLAQQQRVVVGEEGAELGRPVREGEKDVGDEAGLLLHLEDLGAHVVGQAVERGNGKAADRSRRRRQPWRKRIRPSSAPELQAVQARVQAAGGEQLGVAARLDDAAGVDDDDAVGALDRRQAVRDDEAGAAPSSADSSACWTRRSDSESSAEVASSRIRIGASL